MKLDLNIAFVDKKYFKRNKNAPITCKYCIHQAKYRQGNQLYVL